MSQHRANTGILWPVYADTGPIVAPLLLPMSCHNDTVSDQFIYAGIRP